MKTEYQIYAVRNGKLVHASPQPFQGSPNETQCVRLERLWRLWRYWYNKRNRTKIQTEASQWATHYDVVELESGRYMGRFSVESA